MDNIKEKTNGVLGVATDLIKYDKQIEQIIFYLLGRTVIVDNMSTAIKLAKSNSYSFKIVTIGGDVINSSGVMSGGSVSKKTVKILGRSKEIEELKKNVENIKKYQIELKNQKEEIIKNSSDILKKAEELENTLQTIEIKYNVENQKLQSINENIEKMSIKLKKLKDEKQEILNSKEECKKIINENNVKILELEKQNNALKEQIMSVSNLNKDTQEKMDDLNFEITNLKISVNSFKESESSIDEMASMIKEEIETQNKLKENKIFQINKMTSEQEQFKKDIENSNLQIEQIKEKVAKSDKDVVKMKEERTLKSEKLSLKEKEEMEEFKQIEELKAQVVKIDVRKTKVEDDLTNAISSLWDEYELTPNTADGFEKPANIAITVRRVNNLKQDIKELGPVNVDSIEEYKTQKQRYDFMCEQRLDLETAMAKLRDMISEITETMKERFKEKMKIINLNFEETFKELFGGGEARIKLEDENNILECGINIEVQPPGKKLQNMQLLSGGERAFTAIALLFAILKMNPAPFCVLDEIEAALDDVNVNRYAQFLKKFASETQFLIITHRKGTMEVADTVYGITMEEKGISKLLSMKLGINL